MINATAPSSQFVLIDGARRCSSQLTESGTRKVKRRSPAHAYLVLKRIPQAIQQQPNMLWAKGLRESLTKLNDGHPTDPVAQEPVAHDSEYPVAARFESTVRIIGVRKQNLIYPGMVIVSY